MDQAEWRTCGNPAPMLEFLRGRASDRKLRLFVCACCRRVLTTLGIDQCIEEAVDWSELFADGQATVGELDIVGDEALAYCSEPTFTLDAFSGTVAYMVSPSPLWAEAALVAAESARRALAYGSPEFAEGVEVAAQSALARDIFGNPFNPVVLPPALRTPAILGLAQAAYDKQTLPAGTLEPERLAVLADALEESGCTDADILGNLRGPGPHVRGCWCVDAILGRA